MKNSSIFLLTLSSVQFGENSSIIYLGILNFFLPKMFLHLHTFVVENYEVSPKSEISFVTNSDLEDQTLAFTAQCDFSRILSDKNSRNV